MDSQQRMQLVQRILERLRFQAQYTVSRYVLDTLSIEQIADMTAPDLVMELSALVVGECVDRRQVLRKSETIETPATWWDHWKHSHVDNRLFGWLIRRHPANMVRHTLHTTVDLAAYYVYPDAPLDMGPAWRNVMVVRNMSRLDIS